MKNLTINNVKVNYRINNELLIVQLGKTIFSYSIPFILNNLNAEILTDRVICKYLKTSLRFKKVLKAYIESLTNKPKEF